MYFEKGNKYSSRKLCIVQHALNISNEHRNNIVSYDETCSTVNIALENTANIHTIPSTKYI